MAEQSVVVVSDPDLQSRQQLIVLAVLLTIYAIVPVAASVFAIWQLFFSTPVAAGDMPRIDEHWFVNFLGTLAGSEKSILELVHKLVLPLAALFAGVNLGRIKKGWLASILFVVPLVGVVTALLAAILFDSFSSTSVHDHFSQIPTLLTDMASNLGVFTLLMLGMDMQKD
jgi:hypothetical protein